MDFVRSGNLLNLMKGKAPTDIQKFDILRGLANGLAHIHDRGTVHNDIKPDNVLIDIEVLPRDGDNDKTIRWRYVPKWTDFGISASHFNLQSSAYQNAATLNMGGLHFYAAPERFLPAAQPSQQADVYSFGFLMIESLAGKQPWNLSKDMDYRYTFEEISDRHENLKDLLKKCLNKRPSRRPSALQIAQILASLQSEIFPPPNIQTASSSQT